MLCVGNVSNKAKFVNLWFKKKEERNSKKIWKFGKMRRFWWLLIMIEICRGEFVPWDRTTDWTTDKSIRRRPRQVLIGPGIDEGPNVECYDSNGKPQVRNSVPPIFLSSLEVKSS